MLVNKLIYYRVVIYFKMLPLFMLALTVGFIDGLVQRDIRKFQGARESTFFFHRILLLFKFTFFTPLLIYFSLPFFVSPVLFFGLQSIGLGVLIQMAARSFKKYV